jgi:hypothetical protein
MEKRYFQDVLYVPGIMYNLFSLGAALDKGLEFKSDDKTCSFTRNGMTVLTGERKGKLYVVNAKLDSTEQALNADVEKMQQPKKSQLMIWHERLAHQHLSQIKKILKGHGIKATGEEDMFCKGCTLGKMHRKKFPTSSTVTSRVGELIHGDLCGPLETISLGRSRYFLVLRDDYSNYRKIYFLESKDKVKNHIKYYLMRIKQETGNSVNILRTDNGGEFVNHEMKQILEEEGIKHETTIPYTPQQNGKAERDMRTIMEAARALLAEKGLPKYLWAEAANTVVHILNRTAISKEEKSPYELWFSKKPNIKYFKVFGTEVYVHVPKERRKKLDHKARKGIFVGYDGCQKGYRIWFSQNNKINKNNKKRHTET